MTQQTRKSGIHMAMGAQATSVLKLVVQQGMRLAIVGLVLGLVAAFGRHARAFEPTVWSERARSHHFWRRNADSCDGGSAGLLHSGAQGGPRGPARGAAL